MKDPEKNKKFNYRRFVSYSTLFSFIMLSITGLILYITPHGSFSRWTNWKLLFFTKDHLEGIHTVFSFVSLFFIIWHLVFNFRVIISYLKTDIFSSKLKIKKELFFSILIILSIIFSSFLYLPPFNSIINLGEHLKRSWEKTSIKAPIADFESHTIEQISQKVFAVPFQKLVKILRSHSFIILNNQQTIKEIAQQNSTSPKEIYLLLKKGL